MSYRCSVCGRLIPIRDIGWHESRCGIPFAWADPSDIAAAIAERWQEDGRLRAQAKAEARLLVRDICIGKSLPIKWWWTPNPEGVA